MEVDRAEIHQLHQIRTDLVHNDPQVDVNACLVQLQAIIQQWHQDQDTPLPLTIHDKTVAYDSANQRTQKWNQYLAKNPGLEAQFTGEEWEVEKRAFDITGNAVKDANQRYFTMFVACFQNPVFSHSWYRRVLGGADTAETREQFYGGDVEWHEFVMVLNKGTCYIYDPSYQAPPLATGRRNLKSLPLVGSRAYNVIAALKNQRKLRVAEIWVGGGGNLTGVCRRMSLGWIKAGVEEMISSENWELGKDWERVNYA